MAVKLEETFSDCAHCGAQFRVLNSVQRYCSSKCRGKASYKANSAKEKIRTDEYKRKNPLVAKGIKLKRYYGITTDQYYAMNASQNGVCKICNKTCKTGRELAVDHCHVSGKIRGLLCSNCNTGLGAFKDNTESLEAAIKYLKEQEGAN